MSDIQNNSIFWIEVEKIKPNPYQPRREFNEEKIGELAESIRQYGILQPLVVTRNEIETENGMDVLYELIAGERRLRASKKAGLFQVPVIIRQEQDNKLKLELAIVENLQREDLNPIEKARAFRQLIDEFSLKHFEVAQKVGRSREFVSNAVRLLGLPEEILIGVEKCLITEAHAKTLLGLVDYPEKQIELYRETIEKGMTVRNLERISRRIASENTRRKDNLPDPATQQLEERLSDKLGTRVHIERAGEKGQIVIDFFSEEELHAFLSRVEESKFSQKEGEEEEDFNSLEDMDNQSISDEEGLSSTPGQDEEVDFMKDFTI